MESKWFIPPFRGGNAGSQSNYHSKADLHENNIADDVSGELETRMRKLENGYHKPNFHTINEKHFMLKETVEKLEIALSDIVEEHNVKMIVCKEEKEKLISELNEINILKAKRTECNLQQLRILSQKDEMECIKDEISLLREKLEHVMVSEEGLSFKFQERNDALKHVHEDYLKKEKEIQIYCQEYKKSIKEANELNENLALINKLQKCKNELIQEFMNKANKVRSKSEDFQTNLSKNSLLSSFRILNLKLQDIDKEILSIPTDIGYPQDTPRYQTFDMSGSNL